MQIKVRVFLSIMILGSFIIISNNIAAPIPLHPVLMPPAAKYVTEKGKASIKFPAEYSVEEDNSDLTSTTKVMASLDDNIFMFSFSIHETTLSDHYMLAQTSLTSFNDEVGGRIISETDYVYDDYKGRSAEIELEEQNVTLYYRVILVGQIQYQMVVVAQSGNIVKKKDKFFNSFKLTGK